MKELLRSLIYVIILQVISWGIFTYVDELPINQNEAEGLAIVTGLIIISVIYVLYLLLINRVVNKYKLNRLKFNIMLASLWCIISIAFSAIAIELVGKGYLHVCRGYGWDCFLNGFEYLFFGFCLILVFLSIAFTKLMKFLFIKLKKKYEKRKMDN